jgi:hypothetical protein
VHCYFLFSFLFFFLCYSFSFVFLVPLLFFFLCYSFSFVILFPLLFFLILIISLTESKTVTTASFGVQALAAIAGVYPLLIVPRLVQLCALLVGTTHADGGGADSENEGSESDEEEDAKMDGDESEDEDEESEATKYRYNLLLLVHNPPLFLAFVGRERRECRADEGEDDDIISIYFYALLPFLRMHFPPLC